MSILEETLNTHLKAHKIQGVVREFKFHVERRFRFDFAIPSKLIAVEVEGAVWTGGRHTRGSGFAKDCEKYNLAALAGWRVFRFTGDMVKKGIAINVILKALEATCGQ